MTAFALPVMAEYHPRNPPCPNPSATYLLIKTCVKTSRAFEFNLSLTEAARSKKKREKPPMRKAYSIFSAELRTGVRFGETVFLYLCGFVTSSPFLDRYRELLFHSGSVNRIHRAEWDDPAVGHRVVNVAMLYTL